MQFNNDNVKKIRNIFLALYLNKNSELSQIKLY